MQLKEMRGTLYHQVPIESTGNAASTGNLPVWKAPLDCVVTAVTIVPSAAITADGTNFATYTLTRHTAGAGAATTASRAWSATNSVALTEESMTLGAGVSITAGDTLTMIKTVGGTGLLIPNLLVVVNYQLAGV